MATDYVTYHDLMNHLPDIDLNEEYQAALEVLATRACRAIDAYHKRAPGAYAANVDSTRYYSGSGNTELWIGEMAAAPTSVAVAETGVLTAYTTWASTDYYCWPWNALADGMPYYRLDVDVFNGSKSIWYAYPKAVKVVSKFGFSVTPPEEIQEAAIIQAVRWFKRGQQAFQDTGAIVELGQLRYTQQLDPDVRQILSAAKFQKVTI